MYRIPGVRVVVLFLVFSASAFAQQPIIDVDLENVPVELVQGTVETRTLTISNLGDGMLEWYVPEDLSEFGDNVQAFILWDDGGGSALHVGGRAATSEFNGIARWDGQSWSPLGAGVSGTSAQVHAMTVFDGALIVAGRFSEAGGVPVNNIARWDGSEWTPLGEGFNSTVRDLAVFDGELVVAGSFTESGGEPVSRIARWDGTAWSSVGGGVDNQARALAVFNGELVAAGFFQDAGGVPVNRIARWDGNQWAALGAGLDGGIASELTVYDGDLIASGRFTEAGGNSANRVARWDGTAWTAMGSGVPGGVTTQVSAMGEFAGDLVVGGRFNEAGGVSVNNIARWDGSEWSSVGGGLNSQVNGFISFGGVLLVGGQFTEAGGVPANRIARWDDEEWSPMIADFVPCEPTNWLEVEPVEGSVIGGEAQTVSLTFDARDLDVGGYDADVCFINTDQSAALVTVPVTLTVTEPPVADISPGSLAFALRQGGTADEVLTIGNLGLAELEWNVEADNPEDLMAFSDIDYTVPADQFGGSVRWDTGETCDGCQNPPNNFNVWLTGSTNELAFYWPGESEFGGGGVTLDGTTYAVLDSSATIGSHSDFFLRALPDATVDWRGVGEVDGRLGFRFVNPETDSVNYGHARITTTGISGHPATINSWVYNQAGDPIAIGGCDDPEDIPWLSLNLDGGTTPPEDSMSLGVAVTVGDLEPGTHEAQLCVATNDPGALLVAIPVALTVLENEATAAISPDTLSFEVLQGDSGTETLTIGNLGDADLVWSIDEAESEALIEQAPLSVPERVERSRQAPSTVDEVSRDSATQFGSGGEVADGSFEGGTPNPSWDEGSTNFGTPLCDAACLNGANGARTGDWWTWFGGIGDADESGFVAQEVTTPPSDSAELRFWLAIVDAFTPGSLEVSLGGEVVFSVTEADSSDYLGYTEVVLDVTEFADGEPRELRFEGETQAGEITSFFVDDVSLVIGPEPGVCESPVDISWLSVSPTSGATPPDETMSVDVTVDAADLEPAAYTAQLCVATNDPGAPLVEVPVSVTVEGGIGTGDEDVAFEGTHRLLPVAPNPTAALAATTLEVADAQDVRVELFDVNGRRVASLFEGGLAARATQEIAIYGSFLAPGVYILRVSGETFAETRRLTVLH